GGAAALAADGVHLGQGDLAEHAGQRAWSAALPELRRRAPSGFMIGLSTHSLAQVERAAGLELDYIGFGPILATRSKLAAEPCVGFETLREACEISPHPVVAIGGLGPEDVLRCLECGAAGAAMIGALVGGSAAEVRLRAAGLATMIREQFDGWGPPTPR